MRATLAYRIVLFGIIAGASQAAVSGPFSGFVFDPPTASIRPITGIVGAAYLGSATLSGLQFASVAPNGRSAVVIKDQKLGVIQDLSTGGVATLLSPFGGIPAKFAWAQDSSAFVLAPDTGSFVVLVHSLTAAIPVSETIDTSGIGGTLSALAVSSAPNTTVIGVLNAASSGIYSISGAAGPVLLFAMDDPAAMAFSQDGARLYAAESGPKARIVKIDEIHASSPVSSVVLSFGGGPSNATTRTPLHSHAAAPWSALAIDGAESVVYLFETHPASVRGYSLKNAGEKVFDAPLTSTAANVSAIDQSSLLLLNPGRGAGEPLLLLDASSNPELFFVPAGTAGQ